MREKFSDMEDSLWVDSFGTDRYSVEKVASLSKKVVRKRHQNL